MIKIKNARNYKNILLFPTLEGFTSDQIPEPVLENELIRNFFNSESRDVTKDDDINYYDPNKDSNRGRNKGRKHGNGNGNTNNGKKKKKTKILTKEQEEELDNLFSFVDDNISGSEIGDMLEDMFDDIEIPDNIPDNLEDAKYMLNVESFGEFLLGVENFFMFFVSFFNNILIYFSIVITQLSYGSLPITPFDNITAPYTTPNWPWKLNLNVSPNDNIATNKNATLIDPDSGPILVGNTYIPASVYYENQLILYDSYIIYNIFTQILLIIITWVFTNNAYYYIYYDSTSLPIRVLSPENITAEGVVEVKKINLILYTICNTFIASPYDILLYIFKGIKWISQKINLYNFPSLLYIIVFMIILYFNLTYFWDLYNSFINKPLSWVQDPFFLTFLFYGIIRHYLLVSTITKVTMGPTISNFIQWCFYNLFIILVIGFVLYAGYPIMRIMFYVWFIYIFFGFYGFGSNAYEDILKHENKKCESNKFKIGTFIRDAVVYFFSYFFYFVLFILIVSNFIYIGENPMKNPNSSSAIKLFLSIIFLFALMYLVYYILNKNSVKNNTDVDYGDSYKKSETNASNLQKLEERLKNIKVIKTEPIPPKPTMTQNPTTNSNATTNSNSNINLTNPFLLKLNSIMKSNLIDPTNITNFKNKIQELDSVLQEVTEIFQLPISIQKITPLIESKLQKYNGPHKDKIELILSLLKEITLLGIDDKVSNFCNRLVNIVKNIDSKLPVTAEVNVSNVDDKTNDDNVSNETNVVNVVNETKTNDDNIPPTNVTKGLTQSIIAEITTAFEEELLPIKDKLAGMIKTRFRSEIQISISITQLYNSFNVVFAEAQPEIGLFCFIITKLYPNETKAGLRNAIGSVASIGYNSVKSGFGRIMGSKNTTIVNDATNDDANVANDDDANVATNANDATNANVEKNTNDAKNNSSLE